MHEESNRKPGAMLLEQQQEEERGKGGDRQRRRQSCTPAITQAQVKETEGEGLEGRRCEYEALCRRASAGAPVAG